MPYILYNELNGLEIEKTDEASPKFDFSDLYPEDDEEFGEPIIIEVKNE